MAWQFRGIRADELFDAFLYENRTRWDPALSSVAYLRRYATVKSPPASRWMDVVTYTTRPAAGGMISGRAFLDLRHTVRTVRHEGLSDGRRLELVEFASASAGSQWFEPAALEAALEAGRGIGGGAYLELVHDARLTRAVNHAGGGLTVCERLEESTGERVVDVVALSCSDIGGRVPTSIVNSATAGAMCATVSGLGKALKEKVPGSMLVGAV